MPKCRKKESYFFLIYGMLCFLVFFTTIGATEVTTSITTSKFSVGDRIRFAVTVIAEKGITVLPPATESDFGKIAVKEWNLHKTEREKSDSLVYEYIITAYIPEPCTIPRLPFIIENKERSDTITTVEIPLHIISVLPAGVPDTIDIQDLKAPLSAGKKPKWWIWLLCSIAIIAVLVAGGLLLYRRLKRVPPPPPPVPPYEEALRALAELGVKKYLQRGLIREYVFELSEIFKRYIGRRFECNASEYTTEEMIAWSNSANLPKELRLLLEWFFNNTDPVKFARLIPESQKVDRFEAEVRSFIEATKPFVENNLATAEGSPPITPESQKMDHGTTTSSGKENTP